MKLNVLHGSVFECVQSVGRVLQWHAPHAAHSKGSVCISLREWPSSGCRLGLGFFMNFPSATISASQFPLVYPEVNNLWEDKSVCGGELDSQTVEGGWLEPPSPQTSNPSNPPTELAPRRVVALHDASLDGCLKCKSVFQLVPGACQHVFLLSAAIECGPVSPLYRCCNRIIDRPVTLPNQIMETYWFFSFFHTGSLNNWPKDRVMINGPGLWITAATDAKWGKNTRLWDKKVKISKQRSAWHTF